MPSQARATKTPYETSDGYRCWDADWNGYTVSYEQAVDDVDATEQFAALPGGGCQCPHWGYVLQGTSTYVFEDRSETYQAGEFFYLPPGHRPRHEAGTEWVTFSPNAAHQATQRLTRGAVHE